MTTLPFNVQDIIILLEVHTMVLINFRSIEMAPSQKGCLTSSCMVSGHVLELNHCGYDLQLSGSAGDLIYNLKQNLSHTYIAAMRIEIL